jgi:hypothetical protein
MRYLKKFNESKESEFYSDIEDSFIDFIDREDAYIEVEGDKIILSFFMEENPDKPDVSELKNFYQKNLSIINEIEMGFKRLKDLYPNFYYESYYYGTELMFEIFENVQEGDFYKKSGDLIILDYDKIREILNLDQDVKIIVSGDFEIKFKNQDHFIKNMYRGNFPNTDNLLIHNYNHHNWDMMKPNSDFDKLVIDGKKLITGRISNINIAKTVRYYGQHGSESRQEWSVILEINKDLKIN